MVLLQWAREKRAERRYTGVTVGLTGLCLLVLLPLKAQRTEEKRAHTCEHCAEGGAWLRIVFNRWESWGGGWERVCACVLRGDSGVCFSSVCQQANFLIDLSSQDDRTHPCVCVHSLLILSIYQLISPLSFCPFPWWSICHFSLVTEPL